MARTLSTVLISFTVIFASGCGTASESSNVEELFSGINTTVDNTTVQPDPIVVAPAPSSSNGSSSSSSSSSVTSTGAKVWSVAEILASPRKGGGGGEPKCGGEGGFKRCLCPEDVPSSVRYRPAVKECNGRAAAIFDGKYKNMFSVVVRDSQNRDRWPPSGFNGCSASLANSESPPNACSAFKVQDQFSIGGGAARVYCFGASGYGSLFSDVTRLTVKLKNIPDSSDDPLERFCIYAPNKPLN